MSGQVGDSQSCDVEVPERYFWGFQLIEAVYENDEEGRSVCAAGFVSLLRDRQEAERACERLPEGRRTYIQRRFDRYQVVGGSRSGLRDHDPVSVRRCQYGQWLLARTDAAAREFERRDRLVSSFLAELAELLHVDIVRAVIA